jgi:uncharacterized protein YcnI
MHRPLRLAAATALGVAALLAVSAPLSASAHVSLETNTATPGSYDTIAFRVPNESATATTTRVTVNLPSDAGLLASVRYLPVAGWTAELVTTPLATPIVNGDDTTTEAVTQVVFTSTPGSELGAGSLGVFKLFVGPIPKVGKLTLPVDQGYSDGSVVSWNGAADSEKPAPVLYVEDAPAADHDADSAPQTTVSDEHAAAASADGGTDVVARALGGVGLVLGAIALVIAIVGRRPAVKKAD